MERLSDKEIMKEYVLSKIIRYNHRRRLQDESVAEHSFYVSLFCLKIMKSLDLSVEEQNQVLILAALHDTAESKTSDIPHDVKQNYPEMKIILDHIEKDYFHEAWKEQANPRAIIFCGTSEHAITMKNKICLLSPAASSYEYFKNFKEKGNAFKNYVK